MRCYSNFNLTQYNSYRLYAICKMAYFPANEQDLIDLYQVKNDYILLGSGHNVILSKSEYEEEFIIFNKNFEDIQIDLDTCIIEAEAGISMLQLSELAGDNGLSGVEIFYDIPSSLGGAVVMNAGASGEEIKDVLVKVRYLDLKDMLVKEIKKEDMGFEYRNSFFQRNKDKIVLRVWLKLIKQERIKIWEKMETIKLQRWEKQPKEFPNAGSVFKRPNGYYVGAIMDELGLKGFTVGGAKISEKHGGFIVNFDHATGNDILEIIREVKRRVYNLYQIELEVEQRVI